MKFCAQVDRQVRVLGDVLESRCGRCQLRCSVSKRWLAVGLVCRSWRSQEWEGPRHSRGRQLLVENEVGAVFVTLAPIHGAGDQVGSAVKVEPK